MSERHHIEMRHRGRKPDNRKQLISAAVVVGVVALAISGAALLVQVIPRFGDKPAATASSTTPASQPASTGAAAKPPATKAPTSKVSGKAKSGSKSTHKAAPKPLVPPLGMASVLPGSRQIVVATGPALGATQGTLRIFNLKGDGWKRIFSAPCRFGTNGLVDGLMRKQGTRTTPTGIWWPGTFAWGWHPAPPSATMLAYRQTTANIWWSDESGATYNTWVDSTQRVSGEHLVDVRVQYEYAWSTGYNAKPNEVVEGRGTAIFLHIFDPPDYNNGFSAGCVTVSRPNIIRVLQTVDPALKPCFAVGTEATGTPTSIATY